MKRSSQKTKIFYSTFLIGMLSLFSSSAFSQISTQVIVMPDTAFLENSYPITVEVQYLDTVPYTGFIQTYFSTDTGSFIPDSLCNLSLVALASGDSTLCFSTITFDTSRFQSGNNIIVIWSSGSLRPAADSTWRTVYLYPAVSGINESPLMGSVNIYPTLASDFIFVNHLDDMARAEKIKVLDVYGRIVYSESTTKKETRINIDNLKSGVYFLEVILPDSRSVKKKFMKMQ